MIFDFFIPRFVTEDVACYETEDGVLQTVMSMDVFDPEEDPTPVCVIRCRGFSWLGLNWTAKRAGDPMDYDEWLSKQM